MRSKRVRGLLAFAITGTLIAGLLSTPAGAHFRENTLHLAKHAWKDFIKSRVYTRAQANKRYLRTTRIKLANNGPWVVNFGLPNGEAQYFTDATRIEAFGSETIFAQLDLDSPALLGDRRWALKAVEICYRIPSGGLIDRIEVKDNRITSEEIHEDPADRTSASTECFTTSLATATVPEGSLLLIAVLSPDAADDTFLFTSVTTTWVARPT